MAMLLAPVVEVEEVRSGIVKTSSGILEFPAETP
jgi:hypothetical protein